MAAPPEGTRIESAEKFGWSESWSKYANERTWSVLDALFAVAQEGGKSPAQVALNWLLQRPGVTAPIIGARSLAHFEDNLGAAGWKLSEEQVQRLTKASDTDLPYPYDFIARGAEVRSR
jgi:aryl-alcohol dehydrogenase-like predicted oxidoreductase